MYQFIVDDVAAAIDEVNCTGCGWAEGKKEMTGCHSGTAGGQKGFWVRGEEAELTEGLNREMRQASLNYKQQVWIRRGIRSTMEHGIRGRRGKKGMTLISIVGGAVTCWI